MLAKSVAPQKTRVPQAGSSLAFLSPFVPFVPGPRPNKAELLCYPIVAGNPRDIHIMIKRDERTIFSLPLTSFHLVYTLEQFCLKTLRKK